MTNILSVDRYCTGCHETKKPEEFGLKSSGPGGRAHRCKTCTNQYHASYRQRTRSTLPTSYALAKESATLLGLTRICASCNKSKPLEDFRQRPTRKDYTLRCVSCRKDTRSPRSTYLWTTYRLREEDYLSMLETQNGTCAICTGPPTRGFFVVDHNHACCPGKRSCGNCVRGLLCDACNLGISALERHPVRVLSYMKLALDD